MNKILLNHKKLKVIIFTINIKIFIDFVFFRFIKIIRIEIIRGREIIKIKFGILEYY